MLIFLRRIADYIIGEAEILCFTAKIEVCYATFCAYSPCDDGNPDSDGDDDSVHFGLYDPKINGALDLETQAKPIPCSLKWRHSNQGLIDLNSAAYVIDPHSGPNCCEAVSREELFPYVWGEGDIWFHQAKNEDFIDAYIDCRRVDSEDSQEYVYRDVQAITDALLCDLQGTNNLITKYTDLPLFRAQSIMTTEGLSHKIEPEPEIHNSNPTALSNHTTLISADKPRNQNAPPPSCHWSNNETKSQSADQNKMTEDNVDKKTVIETQHNNAIAKFKEDLTLPQEILRLAAAGFQKDQKEALDRIVNGVGNKMSAKVKNETKCLRQIESYFNHVHKRNKAWEGPALQYSIPHTSESLNHLGPTKRFIVNSSRNDDISRGDPAQTKRYSEVDKLDKDVHHPTESSRLLLESQRDHISQTKTSGYPGGESWNELGVVKHVPTKIVLEPIVKSSTHTQASLPQKISHTGSNKCTSMQERERKRPSILQHPTESSRPLLGSQSDHVNHSETSKYPARESLNDMGVVKHAPNTIISEPIVNSFHSSVLRGNAPTLIRHGDSNKSGTVYSNIFLSEQTGSCPNHSPNSVLEPDVMIHRYRRTSAGICDEHSRPSSCSAENESIPMIKSWYDSDSEKRYFASNGHHFISNEVRLRHLEPIPTGKEHIVDISEEKYHPSYNPRNCVSTASSWSSHRLEQHSDRLEHKKTYGNASDRHYLSSQRTNIELRSPDRDLYIDYEKCEDMKYSLVSRKMENNRVDYENNSYALTSFNDPPVLINDSVRTQSNHDNKVSSNKLKDRLRYPIHRKSFQPSVHEIYSHPEIFYHTGRKTCTYHVSSPDSHRCDQRKSNTTTTYLIP